ncbi:KDO2-lipid IV(A) lauroyltransferase [Halospina denitrificans]|uniref:Lipid A biosynthesis acyltransferase n=1 Tax=Halospina denitrificans TaxID=332522 RepID=A0A4R7K207_9GAMM|nr:lipid A biosynthesis acyltransferase [Halospina denitrificans]TDT43539.1 KDO2-lipid IV(A) lauroyltransferase [Halospina denitrificans]
MRPIHPKYYYRNFIHPKYWPTWISIGILRVLAWLPDSVLQAIGRALGWLSYLVGAERRHIAETNIRLCFPELSEKERKKLARESIIATMKGYVESPKGWWGNMKPYIDRLEVHGQEHLDEARRRGKGILMLGGHFSILDFAGPLANAVFEFNHMYRPQDNALFDAMIERNRRKFSGAAFDKRQLREMINYIKKGNIVWYGCDQDFGRRYSVFAPFFGIDAATLTTPAWIARETGASVIFLSQFREGNGVYSIHFSEIFENYPEEDEVANATRLNQEIEKAVMRHPEQYLWVHRRFKTRPKGEPSLYPPKKKKLKKQKQKAKARNTQDGA